MHIYIYIYTLFHHTELPSVWLPRLLSFTTLGKPTIWMVTYLSPSYTRICTHTYTVCFTDSPTSYIYIYIYSVSPHRVNICFTIQMAQFNHTGETNNLDGDLSITILYTHMYTHAHTHIPVVLQIAHHHIHIYIYIHMCYVSPHRVKYLFYRTDSPPLCIHIYTYILCFTTQSWHLFYLTDGPVLPHWVSQQSGWWLIYHHLIHPHVHTYTNILFVLQITHHHTHAHTYIYI